MAKPVKKKNEIRRIFLSVLSFIVFVILVGGFFYIQYIFDGLPSLEQLENPKQSLASIVYDKEGNEIGRFFRESRVEVSIDSIPSHLVNALIDTEDKEFYNHWGVHLLRFGKALVKTAMGSRQGASTITQQLAKNLYELKVRDESVFDTITRKLREWITAVQIEKTYTKDEILEMYFNTSYFGRGAYGIEMASRIFFNKKVQQLTIPEAAMLVALLKSSVLYDPVRKEIRATARRNLIMNEMVEEGHLSEEDYETFRDQPIVVHLEQTQKKFKSSIAPYYIEYIRQQLEDMSEEYGFNIYEDGLTITSSLNSTMQKIANKVVVEHLASFQKQFDSHWDWRRNRAVLNDLLDRAIRRNERYMAAASPEGKKEIYNSLMKNVAFVDSVQRVAQTIEVGFVAVDAKNGDILAMVGGRDPGNGTGLNHVTQIRRQPGSSFKPIIYTVALDNGLYPAYPILNQPFDYDGWQPNNFEVDNIGGFLTLREAIKNSINLVAGRLIIEGYVPLWQVGTYAHKMGIKYRLNLFPSIALGSSEVYPIELVSVFATIANKGIYNEPIAILSIEDNDGILVDSFTPQSREAISEETAYMITNMLETVVNEGTALRVRSIHNFHRPAAGKTGTNGDYKDAWFMGFTPQIAAGVWVGFNDQRISFTGSYGQGAKAACPIWANFMREVYDSVDMPIEYFRSPDNGNIATVNFCKESIYELGTPRLYSDDCNSGMVTDIIKLQDIPPTFNAERDTSIKVFDQYQVIDTTAHEAIEIFE